MSSSFHQPVVDILNQEIPGCRVIWQYLYSFVQQQSVAVVPVVVDNPPQPQQELLLLTITSFIAMAIIPMIFFYFYGFLLFLVDNYSSESFKMNYKIQPKIRITSTQYMDALQVSLFNWFLLGFPYLGMICYYTIYYSLSSSSGSTSTNIMSLFPSYAILLRDLFVFVSIEEIMFYFSHRLIHYGKLYIWIHKFHHTYTAPFGIAAIYAHPIEHMLSNVIPVSMGPLVMNSHPMTAMIWGILALFNTMTVHSGYDFNRLCFLFPSPYFHDWHHEKFNENFGATQVLDYVFGTNKNYLKMLQDMKKNKKNKSE